MNPSVWALLDEFKTFLLESDIENNNKSMDGNDPDWFTSNKYLESILVKHDGSPESAKSFCLKPDHRFGLDNEYRKCYNDINDRLAIELGVHYSALSQMYPTDGYIAWHTNENAQGHNLIFTWSETGDGYFEYRDPKDHKIIRMNDDVGWTCKAGYFGTREDNKHVYHCAKTNCKRITLSYVIPDFSGDFTPEWWQECIDHIQRG